MSIVDARGSLSWWTGSLRSALPDTGRPRSRHCLAASSRHTSPDIYCLVGKFRFAWEAQLRAAIKYMFRAREWNDSVTAADIRAEPKDIVEDLQGARCVEIYSVYLLSNDWGLPWSSS